MPDTYRRSDFRKVEYPGVFNSKEEDHDFLAHHNQELISKGIDPRTGRVFNVYLAKYAADHGDLDAQRALHELVYEFESNKIHPKFNTLVINSYNRIMEQKRRFYDLDFKTRRL